ncbi:hypothetical protein HK096_011545, partial [Nowakowskiella sp. JEL0078]
GGATGFSLDTLLKLKDVRTNNDKRLPTLLHYVIRVVQRFDKNALTFFNELPSIEMASQSTIFKLKVGGLSEWVSNFRTGFQRLSLEINLLKRNNWNRHPEDKFMESMEEFMTDAEPRLKNIEEKTNTMAETLKSTFEFFGERNGDSDLLFKNLFNFIKAWEKARKENETADRKEVKDAARRQTRMDDPSLKFKKLLKPVPGKEAFDRRLTIRGGMLPNFTTGEMDDALKLMRNGTIRSQRKTMIRTTPLDAVKKSVDTVIEEDESSIGSLDVSGETRLNIGRRTMGATRRKVVLSVPPPPMAQPLSPKMGSDDAMIEELLNMVDGYVKSTENGGGTA